MSGIKVTNPDCGQDIFDKFSSICPFGAFAFEDGKLSVTAACKMCKMCIRKGPEGFVTFEEDKKAPSVNKDLYRGIAVYVDHLNGKIHPVTKELLGKAKDLSGVTHHPVYAIMIGHNIKAQAEELLHYGAEKVFTYDDPRLKHFAIEPFTNAFCDFIEKMHPSSILVGATNIGRSLAPRVAARCRTGLTADCTILEMKENTDLVQIRPAFGGNIMAQIVTPDTRPQFCTVRYKIFEEAERTEAISGEVFPMTMANDKYASRIVVKSITEKEADFDISDAEILVACGRGLKQEKDLKMIQDFADTLGASLACTRPLVEKGWFDAKEQIGLSGRTVKPKLIITCGISGAVQFAAGMQNASYIIAINADKDAPIFDIAHCGIVGDLYEVLPRLKDQIALGKEAI